MTVALADRTRWVWQDVAACAGHPTGLFFGTEDETLDERNAREASASLVCRACPVIGACLDYALSRPEKFGVWGGMGEQEREQARRRRMRHRSQSEEAAPKALPAGQMSTLGDMRILRGLAVGGFGLDTVSSWTRISVTTLRMVRSGKRRAWAVSNSAKLRVRLSDILDKPPMKFVATSTWALAQGWVGLPAWEGLDIDDPNSTPRRVPTTDKETAMHNTTGGEEPIDEVVAIHGTPSGPPSKERMEVRSVLYRLRQAQQTLADISKHVPGQVDHRHVEIRMDLEKAEQVLSRWDPGRG